MLSLGTWWYFGFAIGVGAFGVGLLAWSLLWDRSRGRKRCPKCWYSMDAAPPENSLRCPECGHVAKREKRLFRTRRRWRGVITSVAIMLIALSAAAYPYIRYYGIGAFTPATVLIPLFEYDDSEWILSGIDYRLGHYWFPDDEDHSGRLWQWQWRRLASAALARMEEPSASQPVLARRRYQSWLSLARLYVDDRALRDRIDAALEKELANEDERLRGFAAMHIYDPRDLDGSLDRLLSFLETEEGGARGSAIRGIVRIARDNPRAVEHLIDWMTHEDADARYAAVAWLPQAVPERGSHKHLPGVYEALLALEHDKSDQVRSSRIYTLTHLQSDDEAWQTIERAWSGEDQAARSGALSGAYARVEQRPEQYVRMAVEALENDDDKWWIFYVLAEEIEPRYLLPYADRVEARIAEVIEAWVEEHGEQVRQRSEAWAKNLRRKLRR